MRPKLPQRKYYYNPERQALEHFRFPQFLRQTKKAYISFVTPEMIAEFSENTQIGKTAQNSVKVPTYNAIRYACWKQGITCDMRYCRKIFASRLRESGILPEIVDMLQGRASPSILTRHYLVADDRLKEKVLDAVGELNKQL